MLVDRHHVQYLIDLGKVASGKTAQQLVPLKDRLGALLNTLSGVATSTARRAFEDRMQHLPKEDHPWSAVRRLDPAAQMAAGTGEASQVPPAALLVLGQVDDDPDEDEDGNRLPDPGTKAAGPWTRLHDALERWDAAEISQWIGPLGWQPPSVPIERAQDAELMPTPATAKLQLPGTPEPTTPSEAANRAAQEADARSQQVLRTAGIAAAAGTAGALLFALGSPTKTSKLAPSGTKEESP